jgi:hypothetical protein
MKSKILIIGIFFTILSGVILENRAQAQTYVNIDLFYEELSPYGGWTPHQEFGSVWQPYEVGPYWKPYTDGRWEWSEQGWIWISYEPWGWATYHYGRWVYDDYQGWIWIPGTTWAPAWVSWQQSPEYIGWSPLPPDRGFFIEIGIYFNVYKSYHYKHHHKKHRYYHDYYYNQHNYIPPVRHSVFLPSHSFGHHKHAGKAAVPDPHYSVVLRNSRNVTNIKYVNNKVINYGPDKHFVERRSKRKLVKYNIVDKNNVVLRGSKNVNTVKDNTYNVYRPKIERDPFIKTKENTTFERSNRLKQRTISNSAHKNNVRFNQTRVNSNFQEKHQIQNRKHNISTKPGSSNKIGIHGNSNIKNEKVYKHNQQKTSGLRKPGNTPRAVKSQSNKFFHNGLSSGNKNSPGQKSYNKSHSGHNSKFVNKSSQKTNKSNYSSKSASKGNGKVSQRRSHNTRTRTMPTSNSRAFSKR